MAEQIAATAASVLDDTDMTLVLRAADDATRDYMQGDPPWGAVDVGVRAVVPVIERLVLDKAKIEPEQLRQIAGLTAQLASIRDAGVDPGMLRWCVWPGCWCSYNAATGPDDPGWIRCDLGNSLLLCPRHAVAGHKPSYTLGRDPLAVLVSCECGEQADLGGTNLRAVAGWWTGHITGLATSQLAGELDLATIEARCEATPKAPWITDLETDELKVHPWEVVASWDRPFIELDDSMQGIALARFITAARTDVPLLVKTVKRLCTQVAEFKNVRDERDDLRALFELQYTRLESATAFWRREDPVRRANVLPDLGQLLDWFIAQLIKGHDGCADEQAMMAMRDEWRDFERLRRQVKALVLLCDRVDRLDSDTVREIFDGFDPEDVVSPPASKDVGKDGGQHG